MVIGLAYTLGALLAIVGFCLVLVVGLIMIVVVVQAYDAARIQRIMQKGRKK